MIFSKTLRKIPFFFAQLPLFHSQKFKISQRKFPNFLLNSLNATAESLHFYGKSCKHTHPNIPIVCVCVCFGENFTLRRTLLVMSIIYIWVCGRWGGGRGTCAHTPKVSDLCVHIWIRGALHLFHLCLLGGFSGEILQKPLKMMPSWISIREEKKILTCNFELKSLKVKRNQGFE